MYLIAIDPGPVESAYVVLDTVSFPGTLREFGKVKNGECMDRISQWLWEEIPVIIEMPACYGMAVGRDVFETCVQVGRFEELAFQKDAKSMKVYRKQRNPEGVDSVVMSLCKNSRAKDTNVRQALIDLYPASGGGRVPQIGTKKNPGPLYGVSKDVWAALAVGITYQMWLKENI